MQTLTITKGLPASGKSTWAKEQVAKSNGKTKRVNKDDLRAMIDSNFTRPNEKLVVKVERGLVRGLLFDGYDVIVDNTHLTSDHEQHYQEQAADLQINFVVQDFTDVPLATCLKRDSERANSVGEGVIKTMYYKHIHKKGHVAQYIKPPFNPDLPNCIIVDIDGTLAHMNGRSPYDYSKVNTDIVDENVRDIVRRFAQRDPIMETPDTYVLIVSGREGDCREATVQWLTDNQIPYDELYMRKAGDHRDDRIVKEEIYDAWIKNRYNVRFVLDDRDRVVNKWRELGLKCLQVAPGDF